MRDFEGHVALVTGGGSGIGASTAALLGERGARVAVLDLDPSGGPDDCLRITADTTDDAAVGVGVERVVDELGGLDILVNNAGIGATGDVTANDLEEWRRVFDVNVLGAVRVTRAAIPHLRASVRPSVVNVGSAIAIVGVPDRALYSATKGALLSLTVAMAADHVREGIRVNAVAPGTAATPWIDGIVGATEDPAAELAALEARQPIGRLISAEEVAHAIVYLASPVSGSTTGTVLGVDGGMTTLRLPR